MRAIASKLKRKLRKGDTTERCGLVLSDGKAVECNNSHPEPSNGFVIPARALLKHEGRIKGTWHTHPHGDSLLSQEDYAGFSQWPDLTHFIIGLDGVRAYRVEDGIIREVDLAAG